jgi:sigma54-dependent transcription regulator
MPNNNAKDDFLTPRSSYWGKPTLPNLTFNSNLQEFAQRVSYICNLETGGKIESEKAYQEIKQLWKQLKLSKKNLLDTPPPEITPEDLPDDGDEAQ